MKIRTAIIIGCLVGMAVLSLSYQYGWAESNTSGPTLRIGIVSVRQVFDNCNRNVRYRTKAVAEQSQIRKELENLAKEVEAEEAAMKTLKPGTNDYLEQVRSMLDKRARLDARQEYLKQQQTLQHKQWTEQLYQDALRITKDLAKQKGLELVFENTEPQFPVTGEELMLTISTHKLLYSEGCVDLTAEVVAQLDKEDAEKQE
jgi:Skp family chaperone for outer membrane proteins